MLRAHIQLLQGLTMLFLVGSVAAVRLPRCGPSHGGEGPGHPGPGEVRRSPGAGEGRDVSVQQYWSTGPWMGMVSGGDVEGWRSGKGRWHMTSLSESGLWIPVAGP